LKDIAVHSDPIWRDRANFIIFARLEDGKWEQLWARQLSETRFELCCIPFFAYDLALGDEVEVGAAGGRSYVIRRVVAPSGHFTFRVWFGDSPKGDVRDELLARMTQLGCAVEWSSDNLLAVDAPTAAAQAVADHLQHEEDRHRLTYETGRR
jgi:hypothetical protein